MNTETTINTDSGKYNEGTLNVQLPHEIHNSAVNYPVIMEALKTGRAKDLFEAKKKTGQCLIIGSGPSLDEAIPYLKKWEGGIICTTSHALTLIYHGIVPTYLFCLDPFCLWDEIKGIDWSKYDTILITHPGIWPELLSNWPNEILLYRQNIPDKKNFYSYEQFFMYTKRTQEKGHRNYSFHPLIRTQLSIFACSPPGQLFAAALLGYSRMYLVGCDFAYSKDKERFTGYSINDNGEWQEKINKYVKSEEEITTNNNLKTHKVHMYYKKNMISAIRMCLADVWVCGKGAITELPTISAKDMVRKQHYTTKPMKQEKYIHILEKYMQSVGAYVVSNSIDGLYFVESPDPGKEVLGYMLMIDSFYMCPECKSELQAHDYKEHTGGECVICKKNSLVHKTTIDIHKNMKRVMQLNNKKYVGYKVGLVEENGRKLLIPRALEKREAELKEHDYYWYERKLVNKTNS